MAYGAQGIAQPEGVGESREAQHGEQGDGEEGGLVLGVGDELEDAIEQQLARREDEDKRGDRADLRGCSEGCGVRVCSEGWA